MLQALLAERFKLAVHNDTKRVPGFALTAGVTLFLRRQDYRELSREYNGENIELPSNLNR